MPTLSWSGPAGEAIASHVPAFVRVSYDAPGESPSWNLLAVMDGLAVAVLLAASGLCLWRARRGVAPAA